MSASIRDRIDAVLQGRVGYYIREDGRCRGPFSEDAAYDLWERTLLGEVVYFDGRTFGYLDEARKDGRPDLRDPDLRRAADERQRDPSEDKPDAPMPQSSGSSQNFKASNVFKSYNRLGQKAPLLHNAPKPTLDGLEITAVQHHENDWVHGNHHVVQATLGGRRKIDFVVVKKHNYNPVVTAYHRGSDVEDRAFNHAPHYDAVIQAVKGHMSKNGWQSEWNTAAVVDPPQTKAVDPNLPKPRNVTKPLGRPPKNRPRTDLGPTDRQPSMPEFGQKYEPRHEPPPRRTMGDLADRIVGDSKLVDITAEPKTHALQITHQRQQAAAQAQPQAPAAAASTAAPDAQPKKRGRPPKPKDPNAPAPEPKPRGRPPLSDDEKKKRAEERQTARQRADIDRAQKKVDRELSKDLNYVERVYGKTMADALRSRTGKKD